MLKIHIDKYLEEEINKKISKQGLSEDQFYYINREDVYKYIDGRTFFKFFIRKIFSKIFNKQEEMIHEKYFLDISEILKIIKKRKSIIIFGTYDNSKKKNDGYINRVLDIDENVLEGLYRIYVEFEDINENVGIKYIDDDHCVIVLNTYSNDDIQIIEKLIKEVRILLIHGLHRIMIDRVNPRLVEMIEMNNLFVIWDVHGAVPEEIDMMGEHRRFDLANQMERYIVKNSDIIICISEAMKNHFRYKYKDLNIDSKFRTIEVKTPNIINNNENKKYDTLAPVCVYCGGVQRWQNIDLMAEIVNNNHKIIQFILCFAGDYESIINKFEKENVEIGYKNSDEIIKVYEKANFGLALRDDSVVNRVASPTKITEYISNGIVPVLKFKEIGDLNKLGLNFIDYNDLLMGNLPNKNEYDTIVRNNYKIIDKIGLNRKESIESFKKELYDLID